MVQNKILAKINQIMAKIQKIMAKIYFYSLFSKQLL